MTDPTRDRPDAAELLEIARETLTRELLPLLPAEQRLTGLMVANALAIAERELRDPPPGLLDAWPLVHAIRAGRHDGDAALHRRLYEDATARVAIANPRRLRQSTPV
jgi:hypothetical protein